MIDASHANSLKKPERQIPVSADIASPNQRGDGRIIGIMIEVISCPEVRSCCPH